MADEGDSVPANPASAQWLPTDAARLLQTLVEGSADIVFAKDLQGRYLVCNSAAARMMGVPREQVLGHDDTQLFPPEEAALLRANDRRVVATRQAQTFDEALDTRLGRRVYRTTKGPLLDEQGRVWGSFGISREVTQEALAERHLRDADEVYRNLFNGNPHPMWVFDRETLRFLAVNDAAVSHYGYTREVFLAMTIADIRPPSERAFLHAWLDQGRPHEQLTGVTWIHQRHDGSLLETEGRSTDLQFEGRPARMVVSFDLTSRNQAERKLRLSEQRFRLAAAHGQVWDWNFETHRTELSLASWHRLLGREAPEPAHATEYLLSLMHPEDVPRWRAALRLHLVERRPYQLEFRALHGSGAWRWFDTRGQAVWDESGRATYMAGTTFDITERKAAEVALRDSLNYQRSLFEQIADGVILIDRQDHVADANPAACAMFGYSRDEMLRLRVPDLVVASAHQQLAVAKHNVEIGVPHRGEWIHVHKDGHLFPVEVSARLLDDARTISVLRDISGRREAEEAVEAHQRELVGLTQQLMAQEEALARRIAQGLHDQLGQTLTAARMHLEVGVMADIAALPAPLQQALQQAITLVKRASQELRQVLSELRPVLLEDFGLAAALEAEALARSPYVDSGRLQVEIDPGAAARRWRRDVEYAAFMIVREAIANARQHAGATTIRVALRADEDGLQLEVADDGVGISLPLPGGRPGHLGIVGMRERAIGIGAVFEIKVLGAGGTLASLRWSPERN